jgi:tetratricopeptide (TPR) repeat protein
MNEKHHSYDNQGNKSPIFKYEQMIFTKKAAYFDVEDCVELVEHYNNKYDVVKALETVNYALNLHPHSTELMLRKADTLAALNDFENALNWLKKVERIEPTNPDVHIMKGAVYSHLNLSKKAIESYLEGSKYAPEQKEEIFIDIAEELIDVENYEEALKYLHESLLINSENEDALNSCFYCYEMSSNITEGIVYFTKFVDKNPFSAQGWLLLGNFHQRHYENEEALKCYEFASSIDDQLANLYFEKAKVLFELEKYDECISHLNEAIIQDEKNHLAYYLLGKSFELTNQRSKALASYTKAISINKNFDIAWYECAVLLEEDGKLADAIFHIKKAIKLNQKSGDYWMLSGKINGNIGFIEEAKESFEKSLKLSPSNEYYWSLYAEIMYENGYIEEAIDILYDSLEKLPNNVELLYQLSSYLLLLGYDEDAVDVLSLALEMNFDMHNMIFEFSPSLKNNTFVKKIIKTYKNL